MIGKKRRSSRKGRSVDEQVRLDSKVKHMVVKIMRRNMIHKKNNFN